MSACLGIWELVCLWVGVGVVAGTISINYSYEMIHQKPRVERWIADILLAMVLYSHFFRGLTAILARCVIRWRRDIMKAFLVLPKRAALAEDVLPRNRGLDAL